MSAHRRHARHRWTGRVVLICVVACGAFPLALGTIAPDVLVPVPVLALVSAVTAYCLVLATLVARRDPGNTVAPLIAAGGLSVMITNAVDGDRPGPFQGMWMLLYLPFAVLLLVVPGGRPTTRRRAVAVTITIVAGLFIGPGALGWYRPDLEDGPLRGVAYLLLAGFMALLISCAASPVQRYRRGDTQTRSRLRWILMAGYTLPLTLLLCWAGYLILGGPGLTVIGLITMFLAVPAGAALAVVRPQLFDVDRAAVATTAGFTVAVVILLVLSAIGLAAGRAMIDWSPFAALTTTASVAVAATTAFPVLRRRLDRLLFPGRARALAALSRLRSDVESGLAEPGEVEAVLRRSLNDPGLLVAYRGLADRGLHTLSGLRVEPTPTTIAVRVRGEQVGVIIPGPTPPPAGVAPAAAPLVDLARTRAELNAALAEIDASRKRLLRAGYEERRRLERDLHDGAQQRLVALGMRLRVLQRTQDLPGSVVGSLDAAVTSLGTAVAELRQIAHGVRPSALDDGLAAALSARISGEELGLPPASVELDVRAGELPDAVATTAYFVVNEAVANAVRHAGARAGRVAVRQDGSQLRVRVDDDGRGGAAPSPAGGLTGLSDRVGAMGGTLSIRSPQGSGTTIEAVLPCGS